MKLSIEIDLDLARSLPKEDISRHAAFILKTLADKIDGDPTFKTGRWDHAYGYSGHPVGTFSLDD
jgi:hypothetical protein